MAPAEWQGMNGITREEIDNFPPRSPLITEPLSNHPIDQSIATCRAALAAGADPNELDPTPVLLWNAGRPLDACFRQTFMTGGKRYSENMPIIELLLEYGADPRLHSKAVGLLWLPIQMAKRYAEEEDRDVEDLKFWKRVVELFEQAAVRIDAKKKRETHPQTPPPTEALELPGNLNDITQEHIDKFPPRPLLISEPLSDHPIDESLAVCRAALAAGADPNVLDPMPVGAWNAGPPLSACLDSRFMKKNFVKNEPLIKLLLEYGADPRLNSKSMGLFGRPIQIAGYRRSDEKDPEKLAFWERMLKLFEEAIVRLDAQKKRDEAAQARAEAEAEAKTEAGVAA